MSKETILETIIASKRQWLSRCKREHPLDAFIAQIESSDRDFKQALSKTTPAFILECKKASPSKGLIRADFDPAAIARVYRQHADVISVLTDSDYFQGDFSYLDLVRAEVTQPVLCKDFFIDPYQVYLARHQGGDAILLMLSVLDDIQYRRLAALAQSLKMGILTEVSTQTELDRALALGAEVIGINNRNLHDLSTDLDRTPELARQIPFDRIVISESGILDHTHVKALQPYVNGFLVGSALMAQADIELACRKLILGENKICGLTRPEDAASAYAAGAIYGGLIFAANSPRCVNLEQAQQIRAAAPLEFVGVFVDAKPEQIALYANRLKLSAVQLHGHEDDAYINALRPKLPAGCKIWKAMPVSDHLPELESAADRLLLDCQVGKQSGGTGQSFDWQLLEQTSERRLMLAGGLNENNAQMASALGCLGLDFNSGLESEPGIKHPLKINATFSALKQQAARTNTPSPIQEHHPL